MAKDPKNKKHLLKDVKAELKKVVWPTPEQLFKNTSAVITIILITAVIVFLLDLTFDLLNKQGIDRIKSSITTTSNETNDLITTIDTNTSTTNESANNI